LLQGVRTIPGNRPAVYELASARLGRAGRLSARRQRHCARIGAGGSERRLKTALDLAAQLQRQQAVEKPQRFLGGDEQLAFEDAAEAIDLGG